jgi:hypothetical protein
MKYLNSPYEELQQTPFQPVSFFSAHGEGTNQKLDIHIQKQVGCRQKLKLFFIVS